MGVGEGGGSVGCGEGASVPVMALVAAGVSERLEVAAVVAPGDGNAVAGARTGTLGAVAAVPVWRVFCAAVEVAVTTVCASDVHSREAERSSNPRDNRKKITASNAFQEIWMRIVLMPG